jgi:hypothetical protein
MFAAADIIPVYELEVALNEAQLLRALADSLDELETVTQFPADVTDPGTLSLAWTAGDDQPGYQALNEAIADLVKQHWTALRAQVVKQRETGVAQARAAWSSAHGTAMAAASTISAAPEVGLRKVVG